MNRFSLAAAALALLPSACWAQETTEQEERDENGKVVVTGARRMDIIVTANGAESPPEEAGQAITLINQRELDRRQIQSVSDIAAFTPGISATRNGGIGKTSALRIRGGEGDQTLVLIDGVRVNDPSSPGGAFDFGNLLVGNIATIEILRGPNSVPWGSHAIGGVVNITSDRSTGQSARAEYGSHNRAQLVGRVGFDLSDKIDASIGGGYFRDDGVSAFKGGTERDGYRQYATNGRVDARVSDTFKLSASAFYANSRAKLDGFPPPNFSFADTPEFSRAEEFYGRVGAELDLFDYELNSKIAVTIADINRDNFDAPGQAPPAFLARGRTERFEYKGDADISDEVRAVFGAEHERSRFTDGFAPAKTHVTSLHGQLVVALFDDELHLTGGGRLDDHRDYGSRGTFSASGAWQIDGRDTVLRASYGEGFKAPTLFQLNSFYGNRSLKPESAKSVDIGLEHNFDDVVKIGATLFQRNTRNQIDFISCFGLSTGICTNRPFGTYNNVARSRARGLELFGELHPVDDVTITANYSLIDAKDRTSGLRLLRRPKHQANLAADWHPDDKLNFGASLQWVGKSADVDFQTFARISLKSHALASLRAELPIGEEIRLFGRVENLFNTRYETVSGYGNYGRTLHLGIRFKSW